MSEAFRLEEAPRETRVIFSHADADARFGASVFWVRRGILPDAEMAGFLEFWQTRRDGMKRGIVRAPQRHSLEILDRITEPATLKKGDDPAVALDAIRAEWPTVTDFEREFPSVRFALATRVGKTRLMGAFVT